MDRCPNCNSDNYEDGTPCFSCSYSPPIGPGPEPAFTPVSEESSLTSSSHLTACPSCGEKYFDGWDCSKCGYGIPQKDRKMQGKALSSDEAAELKKRLGL